MNKHYNSLFSACKAGYEHPADSEECVDIDECSSDIHTCSPEEICTNTVGSWRCCLSGFRLAEDGETCSDVDECQPSSPYDPSCPGQSCFNTPGSFVCCDDGFKLADDNLNCIDIDECQDPAVCPDLSKGRVQFSIFVSAKVLLKRDPYLGVYEAN